MKLTKIAALLVALTGLSSAATVTVSSGLPAQGFVPFIGTTQASSFYFSVGSYDTLTSTWTQFGSSILDTNKVGGAGGITATSPTSLNGSIVDLFVGTGTNIAGSGASWVIMRPSATTAKFPADVTGTANVTINATLPTGWSIIATGAAGNNLESAATTSTAAGGTAFYKLNLVPEPSSALLAGLGALALLRRRRA